MSDDKAKPDSGEFEFKAQVQQVLSLVINSLYTHSEVFLRELISNASDALDKARFLALSDKGSVIEQEGEPAIRIDLDEEAGTLCIEDNGVGMTRDEVIENLGTIARSGTSEFVETFAKLTKNRDEDKALELIGQFGVGFYSAFMVAQRVDVETLSMREGSEAVLWRSSGAGSFHVLPGERQKPGTRITLHLKEDSKEFSKRWRVEEIVKKYSDFVMFPIRLGDEQINESSALWRQARSSITAEQHAEFFKHITHGIQGDEPLATVHYAVDAPVQFSALLYVPERAGSDLWMMQGKQRPGLKLYAKRVLIMENCESLLPVYLRFVRGVVDSEDLQLNVSRETLQDSRTVKLIEQQLTKQVLKELSRIAEQDAERYATFWEQFGQVTKEGLSVDFKNKDDIAKLCRFESLNTEAGKRISLDAYVANKQEGQDAIWYITGAGRQQVANSPHLEVFRHKGIDVLLLVDPIDEWVVQALPSYGELELRSVLHGDLSLDDDEGPSQEQQNKLSLAVAAIKDALGDKVDDVRLSKRLTDTASCLVSKEGDPGANLERIMKMLDQRTTEKKRILEINPEHQVVANLATLVERDAASPRIALWSEILHDQALLSEGVVESPAELVARIQQLLLDSSEAAVRED
jgi:molecular chaperone HtpG